MKNDTYYPRLVWLIACIISMRTNRLVRYLTDFAAGLLIMAFSIPCWIAGDKLFERDLAAAGTAWPWAASAVTMVLVSIVLVSIGGSLVVHGLFGLVFDAPAAITRSINAWRQKPLWRDRQSHHTTTA